MSLFIGTFVNKVDKKGRVSVPATFRATLSDQTFQGVVIFRSYVVNALEGSGMDRMELLSKSIDTLDTFSQEQDDLSAALFADAHQLPFDGEGRIILPAELSETLNICDQVAFIGRGKTFQIWEPGHFKKHQEAARARLAQQAPKFKVGNV